MEIKENEFLKDLVKMRRIAEEGKIKALKECHFELACHYREIEKFILPFFDLSPAGHSVNVDNLPTTSPNPNTEDKKSKQNG